jgi:chitinase
VSPQGIFNCLSPNDPAPSNGLPNFRNCQIRVSTSNSAATTDQVFLRIQLPDDDDTVPMSPLKVGISDSGALEGNANTRPLTFTISMSRASDSDVTVKYATANQTATAGSDYTARSGTLTIPAGLISVTQAISVKGDTISESAEVFKVTLSNATGGATINRANGFGQILNDDPPKAGVRVGVGNSSVLEGNENRRSLRFTVSLSKVHTKAVKVSYATTAGTATAGEDYETKSGTLTIPAGKTSALVLILIKGDTTDELTETFTVKLTTPVQAVIDRATGSGRITNDD